MSTRSKKNQVYHVRANIKPKSLILKPFFLKGVVIAPSESIARNSAEKSIKEWAYTEPKFKDAIITIIETKKLRNDFIIQAKN